MTINTFYRLLTARVLAISGKAPLTGYALLLAVGVGTGGSSAYAQEPLTEQAKVLSPEQAFKAQVRIQDERTVAVSFEVAPGHMLYGEKFYASADKATLGPALVPEGVASYDVTFKKTVKALRGTVEISVPVLQAKGAFVLGLAYQGCAEAGLCYPVQHLLAKVTLSAFPAGNLSVPSSAQLLPAPGSAEAKGNPLLASLGASSNMDVVPEGAFKALETEPAQSAASPTAQTGESAALLSGRFWPVISVFFLAGLLMSLTPCVLPMLPILSAILAGQGAKVSKARGLGLAISYSLGMSLTYTGLGLMAGLAGEGFSAFLQNPWVLGAFAGLLAALALSMLGVYELRLPRALTGSSSLVHKLPGGRIVSVFLMGALSSLVVSPCIAAPLAGALVYLGQTRDVWLSSWALFSMSWGMSVPLLLLGASAGTLIPKAGPWMEGVKRFFGISLLGVSIWMLQPLLPAAGSQALWGVLLVASSTLVLQPFFGQPSSAAIRPLRLAAGAVIALVGTFQLVGAAAGGGDSLRPLGIFVARGSLIGAAQTSPLFEFKRIESTQELSLAINESGRMKMVEFFAEWCASCKEMDRNTFSDAKVQAGLKGVAAYRIDVTGNTSSDRVLLKQFGLFGPPAVLFFDAQGVEVAGTRVVGYQDPEAFLKSIRKAGIGD